MHMPIQLKIRFPGFLVLLSAQILHSRRSSVSSSARRPTVLIESSHCFLKDKYILYSSIILCASHKHIAVTWAGGCFPRWLR